MNELSLRQLTELLHYENSGWYLSATIPSRVLLVAMGMLEKRGDEYRLTPLGLRVQQAALSAARKEMERA